MAKACVVCDKQRVFGKRVSFSHRKSSRSWFPNLRSVKINDNGTHKKVNVCTRCLRSGSVERA